MQYGLPAGKYLDMHRPGSYVLGGFDAKKHDSIITTAEQGKIIHYNIT